MSEPVLGEEEDLEKYGAYGEVPAEPVEGEMAEEGLITDKREIEMGED